MEQLPLFHASIRPLLCSGTGGPFPSPPAGRPGFWVGRAFRPGDPREGELNEPLRGDVRGDGSPRDIGRLFPRCSLYRAGLGLYDEQRTIPPGPGRPPRVAWVRPTGPRSGALIRAAAFMAHPGVLRPPREVP